MRARLWRLCADLWWCVFRRPAPWTLLERRAAVRAAESLLRDHYLRLSRGHVDAPGGDGS